MVNEMTNNTDDDAVKEESSEETIIAQDALVDISSEIEKKQEEDGETALFYQTEKIGKLKQNGHSYNYEMADGFEFKNEKFYKNTQNKKKEYPQSYVEGCDMGWC
ncbi:YusG family protein [Salipaludibacillus sp. LMS25]|uniref:DUF2553 family protein n=1 Tax=Salipaludibacillus sp. LMS25 TaxID=2924031 RepID=UPI0020D0492C|nr:DUF2553 family protein [Salipaludibacillus sp. LMS25]UTR15895.1 YusG family protein [Salipaludibacillus sp. LMS25]